MVKQTKRSNAFWNALIAEFEARTDGMSQTAFCEHHGVPYTTFYRRRKRSKAKAAAASGALMSSFIELELTPQIQVVDVKTSAPMVLEYGPFRLCMDTPPDPAWLAQLLLRTEEGSRC